MKKLFSMILVIFLFASPAFAITDVVTLGDSITSGNAGAGSTNLTGWRQQLQLLLGVRNYRFVGDQSAPPLATLNNSNFKIGNCGVGGNTTANILTREAACLAAATNTTKLAIILAGINDISGSVAMATITANLGTIIDNIVTNDATTDIYVMYLLPNQTFDATVTTQNADYLTMLTTKQGSNSHIHTVDMNALFKANSAWSAQYLTGTTHPNERSYTLMASTLYNCITNHNSTYCDGN